MRKFAILIAAILPNALKLPLLRTLGMKIGDQVRIGFGPLLLCSNVELQTGANIGHFCLLRAYELRLGKRATIANLVRIAVHTLEVRSQSTIGSQNELSGRPDDNRSSVYLGPASWILPHCFINIVRPIHVGRNVGVGGGSYLFTHGMWLSKLDGYPVSYGPITIGNDVWLPWGCFVMPNITIGDGVIVGACSVVNKSVPPGVLVAGVPAKIVRDQSRTELTFEQRLGVLAEVTTAWGEKLGAPVRIDRTPEAVAHVMGDRRVLVLHLGESPKYEPAPTLNIVIGDIDEDAALNTAIWSLKNYRSSPHDLIPAPALEWLAQGRDLGLRFYPVDEDLD